MEQKILDFVEEKFRFEYQGVQFCPERLVIQSGTGAIASGSFKIGLLEAKKREGEKIRGYFTCVDHRMKIEPLTFSSEEEVTIHFSYDISYLKEGDSYENVISFISSHGEFELPYCVEIVEESFCYNEKEVKTLEDFVSLAREDFPYAVTLFYDKDFDRIFLKNREKERLVRKCLLFSSDRFHALEEFLISIGAKERVILSTDKTEYEYHLLGKPMKYRITLRKNTWGYVKAEIKTSGAWIGLSQTEISDKDFLGNSLELEVELNPNFLESGKGRTILTISGMNNELSIPIHIILTEEAKPLFSKNGRKPELWKKAIKSFYDYRMEMGSKQELSLSIRLALRGLSEGALRDESLYLNAYIDLLNGKEEEVKKVLCENERWEKTPLAGALHLFLKYQVAEEKEKQGIKKKLEELANHYSILEAYLFFMQLESRFSENNANKMELLTKLYGAGMKKVFLFLETWLVLNESPELFKRIDDFMEITFAKALRYDFPISHELAEKYVRLTLELREYRPLSLSVLRAIYEKNDSETVLSAILHQLLKSEKSYYEMGHFLKEGIKKGIKLTGIYELYAKGLKEEDDIEPAVFTYFLYGDGLNSDTKAFMYSYLIQNKGKEDYEDVYKKYQEKFLKFGLLSIEKEKIGKHYLVLYKEVLKNKDFVTKAGNHLSKLIYKNEIEVQGSQFEEVVVLHKGLKKPKSFRIVAGKSYVDMLRTDAVFLLMDGKKRLFVPGEETKVEEIFRYEVYTNGLFTKGDDHPLTYLEILHQGKDKRNDPFFKACLSLEESDVIDEDYRGFIKKSLLHYYEKSGDFLRLEAILKEIDLSEYQKKEGREIADIVFRNEIEKYFPQAVKYYGIKQLPLPILEKFVIEGIGRGKGVDKNLILEGALRLLYHDFGPNEIYIWLGDKLEAPVNVLFDLLRKLIKRGLNTDFLKKRLIEQMLFAERMIPEMDEELFHLSHGLDEVLNRAYLNYRYYRWLLNDLPLGGYAERKLTEEVLGATSLLPVITYLKYLSKKEGLLTEEKEFASIHLLRLVEEGIVLPFFKEFIGKCKVPAELENMMFAYCHADNEDEISIHYKFSFEGKEETSSMVTEWMKNVYLGIFVKEFLLFADEKVKYYISYQSENEEEAIRSGELGIELEDLLAEDGRNSLYSEINHIYLARSLDDKKALYESMKNYVICKETLKEIFTFQLTDEDGR